METFDLWVQIHASTHLLSIWTSFGHLKPFNTKPKFFVPKTIQKIYNNFTDTYDMAMKLCWMTDMNKMNIHV